VAKHIAKNQKPSYSTQVPPESFQEHLQTLLQKHKYRQALDEVKRIQRSHPELQFTPNEAEIFFLRGRHEFDKQDFKQAENSFQRSLQLGSTGEIFYYLAKSLLEINKLDAATNLLETAFSQGILPKEYNICYIKILVLKNDIPKVEELVNTQSSKFTASQKQWVQGIIALKQENTENALNFLQKIKRPITPGDIPEAWLIYTHQISNNWDVAGKTLIAKSLTKPQLFSHAIIQRLATLQQAKTGETHLVSDNFEFSSNQKQAILLSSVLNLIEKGDYHEAGHELLNIGTSLPNFPELKKIRPTLLTLAGEKAYEEGEPNCSELFWTPALAEQPFNIQLAVNLLEVLTLNNSPQDVQRLLNRIAKWIEEQGQKNPQEWTKEKVQLTLANIHCRLADNFMSMGKPTGAIAEVQQAERICSTSPEVIGRKGIIAGLQQEYPEAVTLLTQALENGSRFPDTYSWLVKSLERIGDKEALKNARRRFGKNFGDITVDNEIQIQAWIEALATRDYSLFKHVIQSQEKKDTTIEVCDIFIQSATGNKNSGGRVSLNQEEADKQWENVLKKISPPEQISTLQAICLCIQLLAKREKGIIALVNKYLQKLSTLSQTLPKAVEAYLVVLAIKESNVQKLTTPFNSYLQSIPQPGNVLANIQLQVSRFTVTQNLSPFLDAALKKESQNPLLLLAKATTYRRNHPSYELFKEKGFDIARRLQDAKALQAYREEEAFTNSQEDLKIIPDFEEIHSFDISQMEEIIETMIRENMGKK
jgi:tetratricopeptide (TPR) repeat protein